MESRSLAPAGVADAARGVEVLPTGRAETSPQEVFEAVWRRRWTVVLVAVVCVGAAVTYLKLATPIYTATARLYVTPELPARGAQVASPERSKNYLNTQCELLKSTPILEPVAERPDIKRMKTFADAAAITVSLKDRLNVALGNKDDLIELSLDSTDAQEAAKVVNAVVESYVNYQTAQRRTSATEMLKILRKEKEAREQEVAVQRLAIVKFKQENALLSLQNDRGGITLQRLSQLSEAKTAAQMQLMETAASYEVARTALSDPVRRPELVAAMVADGGPSAANPGRAALLSELYEHELKLAPIRRQLGPGHPSVAALVDMITRTQLKLAELDLEFVKARLTSLEQAWLAAKQRLNAIEEAFQEQRKEALELNATAAKLAVLESGAEQAQKLVDGIESRIKELGVDGETGALNVTVLEWGAAEPEPSKPRKPLVLVAAVLLGGILGSLLAFVRASTDRRLRSSQQVEAALGVPVLSAVPRIKRRLRVARRPAGAALAPGPEAADAYRTIRAAIYFSNRGRPGKTLLVTSAVKGEGKSTLASNLASVMAHAGERTLLIDADLRRPSLHRIFSASNRVGLTDVLNGHAELRHAVCATATDRLDLMTSGPIPPNPSELLSSRRFVALLEQLSPRYDRIVVDAPPVLGMADALILGARCDATLLVVRADVSDRRATEAAFAALVNIGARSVAAVMNGVRRQNSYSRYTRGYYGDYRPVSDAASDAAGAQYSTGGTAHATAHVAERLPQDLTAHVAVPVQIAGGELYLGGNGTGTGGNGHGANGAATDRPATASAGSRPGGPPKVVPRAVGRPVNGEARPAPPVTAVVLKEVPGAGGFHLGPDTGVLPQGQGGTNGASLPLHWG